MEKAISQKTENIEVKIEQKVTKVVRNAFTQLPNTLLLAGSRILFVASEHQWSKWPLWFDLYFNRCRIIGKNFVFYIAPQEKITWS